jgi:HEAT repeat protein
MTDWSAEHLRLIALDPTSDEITRLAAIRSLVALNTREAVEALLELSARQDEAEPILREAGSGLATLQGNGVEVSEWDVRDLTQQAGDAFFQ